MQAREIMRKRVITATPKMTLRELAQIFDDHHISGVPVVGSEGNLVGVVSQTDLVRHEREASPTDVPEYHRQAEDDGLRSRGFHAEIPDYTKVEEVMTPWVVSVEEDTGVEELARQMLAKRVHRVIITREGKLCGIVTSIDMLRALLAMLQKGKARGETA